MAFEITKDFLDEMEKERDAAPPTETQEEPKRGIIGNAAQFAGGLLSGTLEIPGGIEYLARKIRHPLTPVEHTIFPTDVNIGDPNSYYFTGGKLASLLLPGSAGVKVAAPLLKGAGKLLSGKRAEETASNLLNSFIKGKNPAELHAEVNKEIRNLYDVRKEISQGNYSNVKNMADKEGYSGVLPIQFKKSENALNDILSNKIEKVPNDIKKLIKNTKENPTYDNAHKLQSSLGELASDFRLSENVAERRGASGIANAREALKKDIIGTFKKNNDNALVKAYEDASTFHKEHIVPFSENKTIKDITQVRKLEPKNTFNVLNDLDKSPTYVRDLLSDEARRMVLADKLKKGFDFSNGKITKVNPSKVLELYKDAMRSGYNKFTSPEIERTINELEKQIKTTRRARYAGGLIPLAAGYETAKRFVGE